MVSEVVAGQALAAGDPDAFENRDREVWKPTHVDLVGSYIGSSADRTVVRKFGVRELLIPVISELVDHHCQHSGIVWFTHSTPPLPFEW